MKIHLLAPFISLLAISSASAGPIFTWESAERAEVSEENGLLAVGDIQFVGTRFLLDDSVHIDAVGATLSSVTDGSSFFMGIIQLNGINDLPMGDPFTPEELIATTVITAGVAVDDYMAPIDLILTPGYYGLIIGSGMYGTTGTGSMPSDNTGSSFSRSRIGPDDWTNWGDYGRGNRFLLEGNVIPEPSSALLTIFGVVALTLLKNRTTRHSTLR